MDLLFQLPPTCPNIEACFLSVLLETQGMWLAAKDHLKINDGEVKENRQLVPLA
jgi:hypothetical protein